jgi:hypothetical protein
MTTGVPKRVEFWESTSVLIKAVYNSGKGRLHDLSSTGCYIETHMYFLPQAQVRLQLFLPDERRWVETDAVVAWENRGTMRRGGLPPGYGMRFINVPEETLTAIEKLLSGAGHVEEEVAEYVEADTIRLSRPPEVGEAAATEAEAGAEVEAETEAEVELEAEGPPYPLKENVVNKLIPEKAGGIFVLSYDRTQDAFIGRADGDLRGALNGYVGEYAFFYFEVIERVDERFYRECELFHRFGGDHGQLDNTHHPSEPEDSGLSCPVCPPEDLG